MASRIRFSRWVNILMTVVISLAVFVVFALILGFILFVLYKGAVDFAPYMLAFSRFGIGNQLFNTIYITFLSLLISTPIAVGAGVYLAEYAKGGYLTSMIRVCIQTLSSLPSIILGLFGYLVFIVLVGAKWNLLSGALTVSILGIPFMTTVTEQALVSLNPSYKEASLGVGATKIQTILRVLLPACFSEIVTGVVLAAGRAFAEAAALIYTAGMSTIIKWDDWKLDSITSPLNPFRPGETLALHIWTLNTESIADNATELANVSSAVLLLLVLLFSIISRLVSTKKH